MNNGMPPALKLLHEKGMRIKQIAKQLQIGVGTGGWTTGSPKTKLDECMQLMTDHRIRHLPIVDNTKVIGLISIGDVVKEMIVQQKKQI